MGFRGPAFIRLHWAAQTNLCSSLTSHDEDPFAEGADQIQYFSFLPRIRELGRGSWNDG